MIARFELGAGLVGGRLLESFDRVGLSRAKMSEPARVDEAQPFIR